MGVGSCGMVMGASYPAHRVHKRDPTAPIVRFQSPTNGYNAHVASTQLAATTPPDRPERLRGLFSAHPWHLPIRGCTVPSDR